MCNSEDGGYIWNRVGTIRGRRTECDVGKKENWIPVNWKIRPARKLYRHCHIRMFWSYTFESKQLR